MLGDASNLNESKMILREMQDDFNTVKIDKEEEELKEEINKAFSALKYVPN